MWETDWGDLQVARLDIVLQHLWGHYESYKTKVVSANYLLHIRMDFQVGQGDFICPESSMDFDPLHQLQTEINCGEIQTLTANSERFLSFSCGDWIVNHPREITDFNKDSD